MIVSKINWVTCIGVDYSKQGGTVYDLSQIDVDKLQLWATLGDDGIVSETSEYINNYNTEIDKELRELYIDKLIAKEKGDSIIELDKKIEKNIIIKK